MSRRLPVAIVFLKRAILASFHMQNTEVDGALNSVGEPVGWRDEVFTAAFRQSMLGFSIDEFIARFDPPFPKHIKIEVDRPEDRIVAGASATLGDPRHIELDSNRESHTPDDSAFSSSYNYLFVRTPA